MTGIAARHQFRQSCSSKMGRQQLQVAKKKGPITFKKKNLTWQFEYCTFHQCVQPSTTLQNYMAWNIRSFGMLYRVYRWLVTDVSVRSMGPVFKNKAVCLFPFFYLASLNLENGADRPSRPVGNQPPINPAQQPRRATARNCQHHGRSMRSCITCTGYTDLCDGGNLGPRAR